MTQEDKQLLLKDLCPRLPYATKVFYEYVDDLDKKTYGYSLTLNTWCINELEAEKAIVKPYLRPMSSMTEKEKKELKEVLSPQGTAIYECNGISIPLSHFGEFVPYEYMGRVICWLNAHHFDYSGLIEKGLALEAPEGMYND